MTTADVWQPLMNLLTHWPGAVRLPDFWLRDDDAVSVTPALMRLVGLTQHYKAPLALAVIPAWAEPGLARTVADHADIAVLPHGWSHENHAAAGAKKQELGPGRAEAVVLDELSRGLKHMKHLFGSSLHPVLVPPWNRIDPALVEHLEGIGYCGLSVFGPPKPAPLPVINTSIDILNWHGARGCRDHAEIVGELVRQLEDRLKNPALPPIGLLTHHLVHDEAAWAFLHQLLAITTPTWPGCWRAITDLSGSRLSISSKAR